MNCGHPNKYARGMCQSCYFKDRRANSNRPPCSLEGCDEPKVARGKCNRHYQQELRDRKTPRAVLPERELPFEETFDVDAALAKMRLIPPGGQPCREYPPGWDGTTRLQSVAKRAVELCMTCDLLEACRKLGAKERSGVWGGVPRHRVTS